MPEIDYKVLFYEKRDDLKLFDKELDGKIKKNLGYKSIGEI